MKRVLLALFLIFSFASSADVSKTKFEVTDENGKVQADAFDSLNLDIPTTGVRRYKIRVTDLSPGVTIMFENKSSRNIILRFNAGGTSKNQDGATSKKQIVYQVGFQNDFSTSDYYAFSSCEVDNSTNNRPTNSLLIINKFQTKFLKFYFRDCDKGNIDKETKLNLETTLSVIGTEIRDTSFDPIEKTLGLPTVIIGQEKLIDLSTKSAGAGKKEEFLCRTRNNIKSLELYDGNGKIIDSFSNKNEDGTGSKINFTDGTGSKINFTIENKPGTNYRKMHIKLTCSVRGQQIEQKYYFDARPKEIQVSGIPKDGWLYAEQKYKSDGSDYNDEFSRFIKLAQAGKKVLLLTKTEREALSLTETEEEVFLSETTDLSNCYNCEIKVIEGKLESKKMQPITLTAVDAKGEPIKDYNSISEILITGKIYSDGTNPNIINETKGNNLIRPCVAGSRANCEIALAEINGDKSEIYTGIDIIKNQKVLAYNNVGPTVLYGADTEWTKYSQTYKAEDSGPTTNQASTLCNKFESHSFEKRVRINGKDYNLVGCNIPFVPEGGKEGDEINFYSFKPAVYKLIFDNKNSPANDSYGTDKLTYIHTIDQKDYDTKKNEIFEAADFKPSILAIGASLASLKYNRALSHYDNNLKVAQKLKFSGNPANPTITIVGNEQNKIATDFSVTASNNSKTDISDAIMLTLEPNNPYNHEKGYKSSSISENITTEKDNININMPGKNFYAGKNTEVNKLNFKREDLLARSYAHIGKSSVNIDIGNTKNAELSKKIETDKAAFVFSYEGDDLHFVDAAIIAPNVASNDDTADGAVYLAGFCDPTTREACRESGLFISDTIAGHINYFGFNFLAYGSNNDKDIKESPTGGLFKYDQATFSQFKRGADFLKDFKGNEVKIELQGDKAKEYCNIFRNCYPLGGSSFGTTFNSYKARATQWHGGGEQQGDTIVDGAARRKEQRLNF